MPRSEQASFSPCAVGGCKFVAFFHPSYPDTAPPLLTLAAIDRVFEGSRPIDGIDYDTAKTACGIVACNRYDDGAYFALKSRKTGWSRFERPPDGLLRAGGNFTFYFVVDTPTLCYPVVPSFDHWRFPHQALPPRWASLSIPEHAADDLGSGVDDPDRDGAGEPLCFKETEFARVAPFYYTSWYDSNMMDKFCRRHGAGRTGISDLFADIRRYFPVNRVHLIPYDNFARYELHPESLLRGIMDTAEVWRWNSPIRFAGVTREHLFARFAFHVLSDENYRFLGSALKYTVRLFDIDKAEEYTAELYSDDITKISYIFPPPTETTASQCAESDESDESDESYESHEDSDSSCSQESGSGHRRGRRRYRSPMYYSYRERYETGQQGLDDANHAKLLEDRTRAHHASSIASLSLSSTLSIPSPNTPQTSRTPDTMANLGDEPNSLTDVVRPKRSYHDYNETPDTPLSPKRFRLR